MLNFMLKTKRRITYRESTLSSCCYRQAAYTISHIPIMILQPHTNSQKPNSSFTPLNTITPPHTIFTLRKNTASSLSRKTETNSVKPLWFVCYKLLFSKFIPCGTTSTNLFDLTTIYHCFQNTTSRRLTNLQQCLCFFSGNHQVLP